jgi:hypothetical protein
MKQTKEEGWKKQTKTKREHTIYFLIFNICKRDDYLYCSVRRQADEVFKKLIKN